MKFRPSLESLDGRIVPDATPVVLLPEPTLTYIPAGQTATVTVTLSQALALVNASESSTENQAAQPNPIRAIYELVEQIRVFREQIGELQNEIEDLAADARDLIERAKKLPPGPAQDALLEQAKKKLDEATELQEQVKKLMDEAAKAEKELWGRLRPYLPVFPGTAP